MCKFCEILGPQDFFEPELTIVQNSRYNKIVDYANDENISGYEIVISGLIHFIEYHLKKIVHNKKILKSHLHTLTTATEIISGRKIIISDLIHCIEYLLKLIVLIAILLKSHLHTLTTETISDDLLRDIQIDLMTLISNDDDYVGFEPSNFYFKSLKLIVADGVVSTCSLQVVQSHRFETDKFDALKKQILESEHLHNTVIFHSVVIPYLDSDDNYSPAGEMDLIIVSKEFRMIVYVECTTMKIKKLRQKIKRQSEVFRKYFSQITKDLKINEDLWQLRIVLATNNSDVKLCSNAEQYAITMEQREMIYNRKTMLDFNNNNTRCSFHKLVKFLLINKDWKKMKQDPPVCQYFNKLTDVEP